jgi:hypothetical protein
MDQRRGFFDGTDENLPQDHEGPRGAGLRPRLLHP